MKRLLLLLMTVIIISASANAMGEREWKHRNKGWKRHHDNGRHLGHYKYHGRW